MTLEFTYPGRSVDTLPKLRALLDQLGLHENPAFEGVAHFLGLENGYDASPSVDARRFVETLEVFGRRIMEECNRNFEMASTGCYDLDTLKRLRSFLDTMNFHLANASRVCIGHHSDAYCYIANAYGEVNGLIYTRYGKH